MALRAILLDRRLRASRRIDGMFWDGGAQEAVDNDALLLALEKAHMGYFGSEEVRLATLVRSQLHGPNI